MILSDNGYLGPFNSKLKAGDTQHFVFGPQDEGPFWMSNSEKQNRRQDTFPGKTKTKKLSVKQIMIAINSKMPSMLMKDMKNKPKEDIEQLATGLGIPLSVEEPVLKAPGWQGKAKGLLQVLWERGFIDEHNNPTKNYTMKGRQDIYGNLIANSNLTEIMANTTDFLNEVTLLQEVMARLAITVHRLPKYHAELAGEGIEYSWGCAKNARIGDFLFHKKGQKKTLG